MTPLDFTGIWITVLGVGIFMYVVLDGFDLGVGILSRLAPNDHDRHLMACTHLAFDMPRDVADALHIGNGGAAELHHQPGHNSLRAPWVECRGAFERAPAQKRRVYIAAG